MGLNKGVKGAMGRRKLVSNIDDKIMAEVMRMTMKVGTGLVSTKEIAKKLQISEPVIFTHFKTKAKLMNATFLKACEPLKADQILKVCREKGIWASSEDYRPALKWALSFKKETVYIHHYLASSYYDNEVAMRALTPFFKEARSVLEDLGVLSNRSNEETDFLLSSYFHSRIDIFNTFIQGRFPMNDNLLALTTVYLVSGVFGALGVAKAAK